VRPPEQPAAIYDSAMRSTAQRAGVARNVTARAAWPDTRSGHPEWRPATSPTAISLDRLADAPRVEEHRLVCEECQGRLAAWDAWVGVRRRKRPSRGIHVMIPICANQML
jgi:hypothetical protein